ncbi:hypothetical protein [Xanthomonas euvesicatoria]|uniref:hypothetical protein n=1 Tax=Xanthomonas euvesicatoria TaxID=456327 RepID=UPI0011166963|nr:hypothetical protein [Xanthomonas euvesicatoria]MBV6778914.1 hypothetical protein [Xanthomonas campestris pv. carissae]
MEKATLQRKEAIVALLKDSAPEHMSDALADLVARMSESKIAIGEAAWITLCEILYPRPWPDLSAIPPQSPRPIGMPATFNWKRWAEIRMAVNAAIPNLSLDAWRVLFEEFLANPAMTVEHAVRRALAILHPSKRRRHQP